ECLTQLTFAPDSIILSPVDFIKKPLRWLQAISKYQATTSGGPNFAYDLCARKITEEQKESLDLSHWEVAFNGAEPIRAETLDLFSKSFESCGFRREAFYPCYGMADTTLLVTGGLKTEAPIITDVDGDALCVNQVVPSKRRDDSTSTLVGCGQNVVEEQKIAIANPETLNSCSNNEVGEIWVSGPSVAGGYWRRDEETEATFGAYLADTKEGPFLRTGDLGFLQDGELFVTGRLKDLIIIRGRNYYPQDIELTLEQSHPALRNGASAAFAVDVDGEEKLVVACEVERTYLRKLDGDAIVKNICKAIAEQQELEVYAVLLLKTNTIPKTSSGKIQRRACRAGFMAGSLNIVWDWSKNPESKLKFRNLLAEVESLERQIKPKQADKPKVEKSKPEKSYSHSDNHTTTEEINKNQPIPNAEVIQEWLVSKVAKELRVNPQDVDIWEPFSCYGLDSLKAMTIIGELEEWLGRELAPTLVYDYPNISILVEYLAKPNEPKPSPKNSKSDPHKLPEIEPIAVVGIGCRFPGANNPQAFWQLLRNGVDAISEVPDSRWDVNTFYDPTGKEPGKMNSRWGGFLAEVDKFDPQFFGISPREAESIDPQQRLLLEVSWEALEHAGKAPDKLAGSNTGVFVGISNFDYSQLVLNQAGGLNAYAGTGNAFSITANRLSYLLDFHGPSWAVDTACSSSLVAVHQACQSLRQGECKLALAGGVNLILTPQLSVTFSQAGMIAADGRCKTFDADANGYVRGEGCGVVVLKRLSDAKRDGDNILAVIKGSAVNQDGRSNGLTAPNSHAQKAVIHKALENANLTAADINYVEAHGTGTFLGDPIELNSLKEVLMEGREPGQPCTIGSVKTNIGHLEAAAGIAGLIKVVLSLQEEQIPPHLHLKQINPHISLAETPLSITTQLQPWLRGERQRLAGVSSFGFGGTNAHIILGEAPLQVKSNGSQERDRHILTLSAKTDKALQELAQSYETYVGQNPEIPLGDICFTANIGRADFNHRLVAIAKSNVELQTLLGAFVDNKEVNGLVSGKVKGKKVPKIAFLFTGQGSQYVDMGRQIYETQPVFRQWIDRCDEILQSQLDRSLLSVLYPESKGDSPLKETIYTQPALFALEYAICQLWKSWGIQPGAVIGHSLGEYVAACVAGVFTLEEGLKLVSERARLMQELPPIGKMAAVFANKERVAAAIQGYEQEVVISAINAPENITISGTSAGVTAVLSELEAQGIHAKLLQVSHAFHSPLMEDMLDSLEGEANQVKFCKPQIPFVSNLAGKLLDPEQIPDAKYWRNHTRNAVNFMAGIDSLLAEDYDLFLEVGPKPVLTNLGKRYQQEAKQEAEGVTWLSSLNPRQDNWQTLLETLSSLYLQGVDINWAEFDRDYSRHLLRLPTYPFQRKRYWIEQKSEDTLTNMSNGNGTQNILQFPLNSNNGKVTGNGNIPKTLVEKVMRQQLKLMSHQLKLLRGQGLSSELLSSRAGNIT
ncbi:MAG: beta-ketoacyl synthase N-terminal-like domain-containing protein, partial [Cyanobacteria bacterium J06639_18]